MKVGVVVPTRNGGERWRRCAAALREQTPRPAGWVVIDSASDDGSDDVARAAGADVIRIDRAAFDHGASRRRAAEALPAVDVVVFLVQDAVPLGEDFLRTLAEAALADGVAAATARQTPPPDASFLTHVTVSLSPFASERPARVGPFTPEALVALGPRERRGVLALDSVACAVRADVYAEHPHTETEHGEDALLAWALLRHGWALAHEPRAVVEHGHEYEPEAAEERYRVDAAFFRRCFGIRVRPGFLSVLKGVTSLCRADRRFLAAHPEHDAPDAGRRSRALRWAQVRGQWRGSAGPLGAPPSAAETRS